MQSCLDGFFLKSASVRVQVADMMHLCLLFIICLSPHVMRSRNLSDIL